MDLEDSFAEVCYFVLCKELNHFCVSYLKLLIIYSECEIELCKECNEMLI